MNRNGKIALGCGGAGCLGIILIVIVGGVLIVAGVIKAPGIYSPNSNSNYNYNSNRNSNIDITTNTNENSNSSSTSSMSDDDKHKLFQAAGITKDNELIMRVIKKLGFGIGTGTDYQDFVKGHFAWAMKNLDFIRSVNTPEKALAYVNEHIDD